VNQQGYWCPTGFCFNLLIQKGLAVCWRFGENTLGAELDGQILKKTVVLCTN